MILTKKWLSYFIDVKDVSIEKLSLCLNNLGLEVEEAKSLRVPDEVVVGFVKSCIKHPDADKLNICEVDVKSEILTIVCGAKNVKSDIFVAVSKVGATLGSGLVIKKAVLRGQESYGMICSSEELSFGNIGDGIMVLDGSIGELEIGKDLSSYDIFDDYMIDVDITPNRGDCLSILGLARDISCGLGLKLNSIESKEFTPLDSSITSKVKIDIANDLSCKLLFKLIDIKNFKTNITIDLLCATISDISAKTAIEKYLSFYTHSIGGIVNVYSLEDISTHSDKIMLEVCEDTNKLNALFVNTTNDKKQISLFGVSTQKEYKNLTSDILLLEFSYEPPKKMCQIVSKFSIPTDKDLFFRSSRGSTPNLSLLEDYFTHFIYEQDLNMSIYKDSYSCNISANDKNITCFIEDINSIIGKEIDSNRMVNILNSLQFQAKLDTDSKNLIINIPEFRHDIISLQDISEEILRVVGISAIKPKILEIQQSRQESASFTKYKFKQSVKLKASAVGFNENISFVFTQRELQEKLGFANINTSVDIVNPISSELDTLRVSILPNLLQALKSNKNNNFDSINLFEIGSVFDTNRCEKQFMSFVSSGFMQSSNISNHSKPTVIDFYHFADKIRQCLGDIQLDVLEKHEATNNLINSFQGAKVIYKNQNIGYISKLHLKIQNEMKLDDTFICEIDLDKFYSLQEKNIYKKVSKYPSLLRDLSLVISSDLKFYTIKSFVKSLNIEELKDFYAVDVYDLGNEKLSLSVRFELQSDKKTLEEKDINNIVMDNILDKLSSKFNLELRV